MGAYVTKGTIDGGLTPVCNDCGIHLCWDISDEEYAENPRFWDEWICQECNGGVPFNKSFFQSATQRQRSVTE